MTIDLVELNAAIAQETFRPPASAGAQVMDNTKEKSEVFVLGGHEKLDELVDSLARDASTKAGRGFWRGRSPLRWLLLINLWVLGVAGGVWIYRRRSKASAAELPDGDD